MTTPSAAGKQPPPIFTASRSVIRTLLLIVGALLLTAASALFFISAVTALRSSLLSPLAYLWALLGGAGMVLFSGGTLRLIWQLVQSRPIVEIGPDGVLDRRLTRQPVPWSAIRGIEYTVVSRQKFVTLRLRRGAEREILRTPVARLMYSLNQRFGFPGLHISVVGLRCDPYELTEAVLRHTPEANR